jgi:translation initiation factor 1
VSRKSPARPPAPAPFHSPFAGLDTLRDALPAGPTADPVVSPRARKPKPPPPRAVVRLERKGRRGKEVTVVEQLALTASERAVWLADLRRALGCGGTEDEEALVLQGDHRRRVEAWLLARGVGRVSVG